MRHRPRHRRRAPEDVQLNLTAMLDKIGRAHV